MVCVHLIFFAKPLHCELLGQKFHMLHIMLCTHYSRLYMYSTCTSTFPNCLKKLNEFCSFTTCKKGSLSINFSETKKRKLYIQLLRECSHKTYFYNTFFQNVAVNYELLMPENKCKRSKRNQLCLQVRQMKNNGKCSHFEKLGT